MSLKGHLNSLPSIVITISYVISTCYGWDNVPHECPYPCLPPPAAPTDCPPPPSGTAYNPPPSARPPPPSPGYFPIYPPPAFSFSAPPPPNPILPWFPWYYKAPPADFSKATRGCVWLVETVLLVVVVVAFVLA